MTRDTSVLQLLDQFRRNNQSVAIILEASGQASGILTLDQIVDAIFGPEKKGVGEEEPTHFVDRTLQGSMTLSDFNAQFISDLAGDPAMTLSDLICSMLDHPPARGETIQIGDYEFTVLEPSLRGVKTVNVQSH